MTIRAFNPETSYTMLAHPDIAKRIGLSDEQRAQISVMLSERSAAIQQAAGDSKAESKVKLDYEQKLSELLTPQQREEWPDKVVQRTLRFNFRFQLWTDVLEWFAEEAGLSLVMNVPPPGTFNYSDAKQYTPEEAIDVLNSVLLTHGFTLIRRDKMLIVQDLSQGIPDGLVPLVDVKELDNRGDFELVTVRIPLEKREATSVIAEITPVKGVYGQIVPLPTTAQLLITDTARNIRTMVALVEAIPVPQPPKKEEPPREKPAPPPPELVVYSITRANPLAVQAILARMIPSATLEFDEKRAQLYVYAVPNDQTTVARVLENMETELPPEQQRTLEIYSIKDTVHPTPVAPPTPPAGTAASGSGQPSSEQIIYDSRGRPRYRIDAYGRRVPISAAERAALEQQPSGGTTTAAPAPAAPTTGPTVDSFLDTLQQMVPAAELHLDREGARVMAFATAEEHEIIRSVLEELGSRSTADEVPLVEVYPITHSDPDSLKTMFESLFPGVQINIDKATNKMVIFGYPAEHTMIKETLDRLMPPTAEGTPGVVRSSTELRFYPLKDAYPATLEAVLAGLVPNALVTYDTYNSRLIVVGSATDHELIARGVEQLETAKAEDRSKLVVYPVTPLQKNRFTAILQSLISELPGVIVVPDVRSTELAIWATALNHEAIAGILKQFDGAGTAPEGEFQMVAYPVKGTDPASIQGMLEKLFPNLQMLVDRKGAKLLVWATTAEHEQVKKSIANIVSEPPPEEQPRFETYTIRSLTRRSPAALTAFQTQLTDLVPNAQLTFEATTGELIVWGTPEEQKLVETAIERLGHGDTPENTPLLKVYSLDDMDPTVVQTLLTQLVRDAQISLDAKSNKLMATAVPADQDLIQKTLDELVASDVPENKPEVRFHTLEKASATEVVSVLRGLIPKAEVTIEPNTGRLMIVASPKDQEKAVETIAKMEEGSDSKAELRFLELQEPLPQTVLQLLNELAPKAEITPDTENDRLMVVASPEDHEKIAATITKVEEAGSTKPELRFYPIEEELPAAVMSILATLAPRAQITRDSSGKYLSVVASPAEHEIIQSTIEQVRTNLPAEEKEKLAVYSVTAEQQKRFQTILASVQAELPGVKVIPDSTPGQLSIWAKPSEHEVLAGILDELSQDLPPEDKFQLVAYPLKATEPSSAMKVLAELYPNTRITLDSATNRLLIWTRAEEHEAIRRALEQIDVEGPAEEQRRFEVYAIGGVAGLSESGRAAKAAAFLANLQTLVPNAKLTIDSETGNLVAFATPSEHEIIRTAVEKLGKFSSAAYTPQLEVHELTDADPTSTLTILKGLVPRAEITHDTANNRLIVLAPPDSQMAIRNTLAQLQSTNPGANDPQARVIQLKQKASASLTEVLKQLAPKASVTMDEEGKRLVVVATEADHQIVERTVQQIDGALGADEENALMVYPVSPGQRKRFQAVVESLAEDLPEMKVIDDEQPTQLSVWARPREHQVIGEILMQLKAGVGPEEQKRFEAYSIQGAVGYETAPGGRLMTAATLMTGIQELVPGAKLMIDANSDKLIAWASPEEHEMLKAAVEKLAPASGENAPQLQVHMLKKRAPDNLVDGLKKLAPRAEISIDSEMKRLTVVGNSADQQAVQAAIDKIQSGGGEDGEPYFEIYPVSGIPASNDQLMSRGYSSSRYFASRTFADQIEPFAPNAEITVDYEKGNLLVLGTAKEHAAIKAAIAKLQAGGQNTPELQIYTLKNDIPETLAEGLAQLVPHAKIAINQEARQISVVAVATDHKVVKETLDKIEKAAGEKEQPFFKVYAVTAIETNSEYSSSRYYAARSMLEQLEKLVPNANISIDFTSGNLLVFATQEEHTAVESAIAGLTGSGSAENPATVAVYRMNNSDERAVFQLLQNLVPRARLSFDYRTDSIMALATADDHELIKTTIAQLDLGADNPNAPELRFHTMQQAPPKNLIDGLEELVPKAEITYDPDSRQLMVIATAAEHTIVEKNLTKIQETAAAESKGELVVYPIDSADMDTVQTVLEDLYPEIRIQVDAKNDRIMVTAMPDQHEKIAAAIEKMDSDVTGGSSQKTVAYTVGEVDAATAIRILQTLVEDMQFNADASGTRIVAFGRERDHKIVAEAIEQMEAGPDETHKAYLMVYPTGDAELATLTQIVSNLVPKAKVVPDTASETLAVFAIEKDQETVRAAIESMAITAMGAGKPMAMTYSLQKIPAASATQILRLAVPAAQTATGGDPQQLVVWANARDQATIKATLEAIDVESPEGARRTAAVYALEGINPNYSYYSLRIIREAVPTASMTLGADPTQVVVWATPEEHETIKELVKSIVEQPPELMPVMEIYALEKVDALVAIKILQGVVRDAELSVGSNAGQLVAWARPKDQERIKAALAKLTEADASPTAPTMEIYKLQSGDAPSAITTLTTIVPEAKLSVGKDADQLIAWARPADHEKIKAAVAKIDAAGPKPTMKIYTLERLEALSVTQMLRSIVPEAVCSIGADSRQLVVWATDEDHVEVDNAIKEMSATAPDGMAPIAVTYELSALTAVTAEQILKEVAPGAKFTKGDDEYQLIIWARPDEHKEIETTLQRIDAEGAGGGSEKTVIYELDAGNATQLYYVSRFLQQAVPKATLTPGVNPNQIVALARPRDHEKIKELIEQLADKEKAPTAIIYDAGNVPAATVTASLRQIVPEAVVTPGATPSELVVWTDPKSHEKVKEVVDKLKTDDTPERASTAVTYTLEKVTATTAIQILRLAVPQVQVSPGAETYQILVWARPAEHLRIEEILKQIDVKGPEDKEAKAIAYKLDGANATQSYYILLFLTQSVPTARFTMGVSPDQIIAWAQPKVHQEIATLLDQIQGGAENAPKLVVYELKNVPAASALTMLRSVVPQAIPTVGNDPYQLVVWARGDEHEKVKQLVDEFSAAESPEMAPRAVTYTLEEIATATAIQILQLAVPQARVSPGAETYQILVWARPDDQKKVEETLAQIDVKGPEDKEAKAIAYKLDGANATQSYYIFLFLTQSVPTARFTMGVSPDQIIAWAQPKVHEEIAALIDQIQGGKENAPKAMVYKLKNTSAAVASVMIRQMVPGAIVSPGEDAYELIAWARGDEHEKIAKLVDELSAPEPPETAPVPANYTVEEITAAAAMSVLRTVAPQAQLTPGTDLYQFVALSSPEDHELIRETLLKIDVDGPEDKQAKLAIYDLKNTSATAAITMVRQIAPTALTTVGATPFQLIVWARPDEHEDIQKAVDQLAVQDAPDKAFQAKTYTLEEIAAPSAMTMLQLAVPQAQVSAGSEPYQLIVWARPDDQVLIEQTLAQIDVKAPDDKQATVKVYELGIGDIRQMVYVLQFLQSAVPESRLTLGSSAKTIVAWARPKDHEEIQKLVDEFAETPETTPRVVVYSLENTTAASAMQMLVSTFPLARFNLGTDPYQLIVWARGEDHEKIAEAVKGLSAKEPEATAPRMIVYPLESADAAQAMVILRQIVPQAQFGMGANTRQLIAWARPGDHETIKKVIEEMGKTEPEETAPRVQVYTTETVDARTAMSVLLTAVPEATVSVGNDARQLVVFARPKEHEKVKVTLDQLAEKGPVESQPSIVVYSLGTAGAAQAIQILTPVVPQAKFTMSTDPTKLIAWAYPEDHALIKAAVDQIEADSWLDGNRIMSVYPMKPEDVKTLMDLIDPVVRQHAQFLADPERESLIVWADKRYNEAIKRTVEEFKQVVPEIVEPTAVVYRFEKADIATTYRILQTLVPEALIAFDYRSNSIVATAMPEDHEKIRQTIEEMNRDALAMAPRLQVHQITSADPARVLSVLTNLFRGEYTVQLSVDEANDALIAYASPIQHEKIAELIAEIEKGAKLDTANRLKLYDLKNVDGYAAESVLADMFQRQGVRVDLTVDRYRNQLIAMGRPEHHEKIAEVLEQFRIEDRELEIFQLEYVELTSANLAIRQLFADESYLSQPEVNPDPATGQLFVKASAVQLDEIRKLLIRMGETNLVPARQSSTGNLRVVPFKGDTKKVIEEIQKVWPSLRPNAIRVVTPGDLSPPPAAESKPKTQATQPQKEPAAPEKVKPEKVKPENKKVSAKPTGPSGPQGLEGKAGPAGPESGGASSEEPEKGPAAAVAPAEKHQSAATPVPAGQDASAGAPAPAQKDAAAPADQLPAAAAAETVAEAPAAPSAPPAEVLIIAGEGSFTIASEDKEALDELETLLRTIAARTGFASRDYSVFQIQNSTASQIAQTLQQLFRTRDPQTAADGPSRYGYGRSGYGYGYGYGYGSRMQAPLIVPDDRLNTILVKGTRADRQTIEGLLELLDTAEMAESVATAFEPKTIPIKHTEATRVMQMVQSLYRSYFATGMANSNFTPQITVDEITNSLIVKAAPAVLEEITKFAQSLDTAADEDAAERLHVIQLKSANALRVQEMLNAMMRGGTSGYGGTSPYRTTLPYRITPYQSTPYRPR